MRSKLMPIGIIHSPYHSKGTTPIEGTLCPDGRGSVEVFPEYEEGLKDIKTFSYIILLYQFERLFSHLASGIYPQCGVTL